MLNAEKEIKKWEPVLEHADAPAITDRYKKAVTAKLLENTEKAIKEEAAHSSYSLTEGLGTDTSSGNMPGQGAGFDPILISLVRRAMPNLIAYDVAGVQPMSGPTGLIFAMEPRHESNSTAGITAADSAAFAAGVEPGDVAGAGTGTNTGDTGVFNSDVTTDASAEAIFDADNIGFDVEAAEDVNVAGEMGFTLSKTVVEAKTRQLKAEYTMEMAQDLKAVHGLDAEAELANILSGEILGEINREVIRTIIKQAKLGVTGVQNTAKLDLSASNDSIGRWAVEKYQYLAFAIEKEANKIAEETRRGKGNFVICSSNVASALAGAGKLTFGGDGSLNVDSTGNTFAGLLNGSLKVYVDPYAGGDYAVVGYKGDSAYDAGLFYCPYVPLTMIKAVGENTFQPKIAFKTRYGIAANPFVTASGGAAGNTSNLNQYYRKFGVVGI
jgi:hypothetical protein